MVTKRGSKLKPCGIPHVKLQKSDCAPSIKFAAFGQIDRTRTS